MAAGRRQVPRPIIVVYDPDAVLDLEAVKGKDDRKGLFNAVDKLRRLGIQLAPPHVKLLKRLTGSITLVLSVPRPRIP